MIMDVSSQETSNQWWEQSPLGADNTTDSLSDDAGGQISVISFQKYQSCFVGRTDIIWLSREMD